MVDSGEKFSGDDTKRGPSSIKELGVEVYLILRACTSRILFELRDYEYRLLPPCICARLEDQQPVKLNKVVEFRDVVCRHSEEREYQVIYWPSNNPSKRRVSVDDTINPALLMDPLSQA